MLYHDDVESCGTDQGKDDARNSRCIHQSSYFSVTFDKRRVNWGLDDVVIRGIPYYPTLYLIRDL